MLKANFPPVTSSPACLLLWARWMAMFPSLGFRLRKTQRGRPTKASVHDRASAQADIAQDGAGRHSIGLGAGRYSIGLGAAARRPTQDRTRRRPTLDSMGGLGAGRRSIGHGEGRHSIGLGAGRHSMGLGAGRH